MSHNAEKVACVCGQDEPCDVACARHDRVLHGYPCGACQAEWEAANPKTADAIARFAAGKCSKGAVDQARRADASTPPEVPSGGES